MAIILNIDTATENASVCLSVEEKISSVIKNNVQKEHASFIHDAIKTLVRDSTHSLKDLDAIAITAGPGSYTGLRVGMATAKGLCYALNKPLIAINTLEVMASAAMKAAANKSALYCPMIDARRMDVFTAIYSNLLEIIYPPCAITLQPETFDQWLDSKEIYFSGNGAAKFAELTKHQNAAFITVEQDAADLAKLALASYKKSEFANLAYAEPLYLKEFYSTAK